MYCSQKFVLANSYFDYFDYFSMAMDWLTKTSLKLPKMGQATPNTIKKHAIMKI
jgi:hypothetical protein